MDYGDTAISFDFDRNRRLVTSSLDGKLRLYDNDFHLIKAQPSPEGRKPHGVAFSPNGATIAVGYAEPEGDDPLWPPAIDVVSAADLSVLFRPDVRGIGNGALWRVAWSADGRTLYAGGTWQKEISIMSAAGAMPVKARPADSPIAPERILRLQTTPQGILYSAVSGDFGLIGADGQLAAERPVAIADFTEISDKLAVSADGTEVRFASKPRAAASGIFRWARDCSKPETRRPILR